MRNITNIKAAAKQIPFLFRLVGFFRYLSFRKKLRLENVKYRANSDRSLPPPMLRYRVHKELDQASYHAQGAYLAAFLEAQIKALFASTHNLTILDFACGPGRVIVKLQERFTKCEFHGSDIDPEAITWAKANLGDVATFDVNEEKPPTTYEDNIFDVVYTISLFTHLDEARQHLWLNELFRIIKSGGYLIASVHGVFARASCSREELDILHAKGFLYRTDHKGRLKLDGLPDFYQTTFHSKDYVLKEWARSFHVEKYMEGGLSQHHDVVILRKP